MLQSLAVRNFQSLYEIDLTLAPFTVIVGPSSSGKSALVRALHTLTHNRRGNDFISMGERTTTITATTEHGTVSLTRTAQPGDSNAYVLIPAYSPEDLGIITDGSPEATTPQQQRFTKLNGNTPEEIQEFFRIRADSHTFAAQHDKPFMLDETGSYAANALGQLTNVSTIFQAAAEANRQKRNASQTLSTRATDLDRIKDLIPGIQALHGQSAHLDTAEEALTTATAAQRRLQRLHDLTETITVTQSALQRLHALASASVPDITGVTSAQSRLDRLTALLTAIRTAQQSTATARGTLNTATAEHDGSARAYSAKLATLADDIAQFMQDRLHEQAHSRDIHDLTIDLAAEWATQFIVEVLG